MCDEPRLRPYWKLCALIWTAATASFVYYILSSFDRYAVPATIVVLMVAGYLCLWPNPPRSRYFIGALRRITLSELTGYLAWYLLCIVTYERFQLYGASSEVAAISVLGMCILMALSRVARAIPNHPGGHNAGMESTLISRLGVWLWDEELPSEEPQFLPSSHETALSVWQKTIDTQMHFNEMLQRIRIIGLAAALTLSGAAAATISPEKLMVLGLGRHLYPVATFVQLGAVVLLLGLMFFESYFFALLLGAVQFGCQIERVIRVPHTAAISHRVPGKWAIRRMSWYWYSAFVPSLIFVSALFAVGGSAMKPTEKPINIAVDMDGVVTDFVGPFLSRLNQRYATNHTRHGVVCYDFDTAFGYHDKRCIKLIKELAQQGFYYKLPPIADSIEILCPLAQSNNVTVVTVRPSSSVEETRKWLDEHGLKAAGLITTTDKTKHGKWDIFIEDSVENAAQVSTCADLVILLNAPWNEGQDVPNNVQRASSWSEIHSIIEQYRAAD